MKERVLVVSSVLLALGGAFAACSSEDGASSAGGTFQTSGAGGTGGATATSGGGGDDLTTSTTAGTGGAGGQEECAADEAEATVVQKPVDILFVIDNSGSMGGEIEDVQNNISVNFAQIIEASGIDYQVIMLSRHGDFNGPESICVSAPLSGTDCNPIPPEPVNNPPKFAHHSVEILSNDAWCHMLADFASPDEFNLQPNGYGALFRPEAFKTIVVITDDRVNCDNYNDGNTDAAGTAAAAQFDADLLALSPAQFGDANKRNYVFHSIIALEPYDPNDLTAAWPPDAPITTKECSPGAANVGTGYQALSKLTGGLRYPTCGLDYTTIFQKIAEGVVEGAKVACEFALPVAPPGETIDPATIVVVYTPSDGSPDKTYHQVADASQCTPTSCYIEGGLVKLCPEACDEVQADDGAKLKILSGCKQDVPM